MKQFVFDRLVDRENLCDLEREQKLLIEHAARGDKVVVYAPRNFGKTSVVKNIVIPEFRRKNRRSFVFFADLMQVRNMESLVGRLSAAFGRCFEESFPLKNLLENAGRYLASLKPEVALDELSGKPTLSLGVSATADRGTLQSLLAHLGKIADRLPTLVVLDEFQDIVVVEEAVGILREAFEQMSKAAVLLLGSKHHLLSEIFARPGSPLAGWGTDLEFQAIAYEDYCAYINQRLAARDLSISGENARFLQDLLQRVPEAINRLCQQLLDLYTNQVIGPEQIISGLRKLLENRESRYEAYLSRFSASEEKVLLALARAGGVEKPLSKSFLLLSGLSNRTVALVFKHLLQSGVIERSAGVARISDPLLSAYLRYHR